MCLCVGVLERLHQLKHDIVGLYAFNKKNQVAPLVINMLHGRGDQGSIPVNVKFFVIILWYHKAASMAKVAESHDDCALSSQHGVPSGI